MDSGAVYLPWKLCADDGGVSPGEVDSGGQEDDWYTVEKMISYTEIRNTVASLTEINAA